jgi:hypothetical protein
MLTEAPRYVGQPVHEWALKNREFLRVVFEAFERDAEWPPMNALQRRLVRGGARLNVSEAAYELPRALGYREAPPEERIVLSLFALRYVDEAMVLLTDFIRVLRLVADRYTSSEDELTLSREDLTMELGLSPVEARRLGSVLVRGIRFLGGGPSDTDDWKQTIHEPGLVPFLDVHDIDEYLSVEAGFLRQSPIVGASFSSTSTGFHSVAERSGIFLVHGHDEATLNRVARFLDQVTSPGATILREQADEGRTIIEKFETHAANAGYAVVLLTADDEGRASQSTDDPQPRARQNVILELGFFIGALGRQRVALLYQEGVERPSDIDGVLYLPLDAAGVWRMKLGRELDAAGVAVDASKLLRLT